MPGRFLVMFGHWFPIRKTPRRCFRSEPDRHNFCLNTVPKAPCTATGTNVIVSARSNHPGGVSTSLADGSVRFMADSIDVTLFRALGSRAGGEVASGEF